MLVNNFAADKPPHFLLAVLIWQWSCGHKDDGAFNAYNRFLVHFFLFVRIGGRIVPIVICFSSIFHSCANTQTPRDAENQAKSGKKRLNAYIQAI